MQGNLFSTFAFFAWIPIALWIARRWPRAKAAALLFLLPVMFLPERIGFKLTGLPTFDKGRIAIFWVLVAVGVETHACKHSVWLHELEDHAT